MALFECGSDIYTIQFRNSLPACELEAGGVVPDLFQCQEACMHVRWETISDWLQSLDGQLSCGLHKRKDRVC